MTSPSDEDLDKIDRIGEADPMVRSSAATPDSQLIESLSTDQSRSPSLDIIGSSSSRRKVCLISTTLVCDSALRLWLIPC